MRSALLESLLCLAAVEAVYGQACSAVVVNDTVPNSNTAVQLNSYSYCGGSLNVTVFIANLDYDKVVDLYYTNAENESTALSVLSLGYEESINGTNFELWTADVAIYVDGITELLNLTYEATDIDSTYYQILNLPVEASGAPAPTLPSVPAPYATPSGFGKDITQYLAVSNGSELEIAFQRMFLNINPAIPGAALGVVVAARSGPDYPQTDPDYEYNWVRDSSLTFDVVRMLYAAATKKTAKSAYETLLFEYAQARATEQTDPGLQTGLGEPKFFLNNSVYSLPWGRPQNDGPATSSITLMEFANEYLASGGNITTVKSLIYDSTSYPGIAPVQMDLLFVASNWSSPSYDLWEEEESDHFYTRMVQRRALKMGIQFAERMGDSATSATLSGALTALTKSLSVFYDPNRQILLYEYGPVLHDKSSYLDVAVILAIIHGYANDNVYSFTNDEVLSSVVRISTSFIDVYPIANTTRDASGRILGIPIGRYPEDIYNGTGTEIAGGNPWYLATAAMSQFMYSASQEYTSTGSIKVTNISLSFFDYFAPEAGLKVGGSYGRYSREFEQTVQALNGWGDAFMRTIKYYTPTDGHLSEEINRDTGVPQGAADLTWSYAALITAAFSRASVAGQSSYVRDLANLGFAANS